MTDAVQIYDGGVLIEDDKVAVHEDCCCPGFECIRCLGDEAPPSVTITLAAIANDFFACCDDDNRDYVTDNTAIGCDDDWYSGCYLWWTGAALCELDTISVCIQKVGADYIVLVKGGSGGAVIVKWVKNYGATRPDCVNWANEDIPFSWQHPDWAKCDYSNSTCKLTA